MSSRRKLKCCICKNTFDREILINKNSKNYCEQCLTLIEKEKKDREELISYICTIFRCNYPNGRILRQIKNFKEVNKYEYSGIAYTLYYILAIEKRTLNNSIALVEYYYDKAKEHYEIVQKASNSKNVELKEANTVNIKRDKQINRKLKTRYIDISTL